MRDLIHSYLNRRLSRRGFMRSLANWGFSAAAAASILDSLDPLIHEAHAAESGQGTAGRTILEGTGGELLVAQLRAVGVQFVFNCTSSGTYAIFDALVDRPDIQVIQVPQEGQMISIAQGYTLASGKAAFTINGSAGFPNTLNNMYNAWKDRTPIVIGSQRQPSGVQGGRDGFEEWDDYLGPSASFTRWRWSVDQAERIPEITRRAFKIAATPPEGPVTLAFPVDLLTASRVRAAIIDGDKFLIKPKVKPDPGLISEAARLLVEAQSPILLVGPEVSRSAANDQVLQLAEHLSIPVTQGEWLFDDFPTDHALFLGPYRRHMPYPRQVDVVLNLGAQMPYQDRMIPDGARVIHVSIDPNIIGRLVPTDVGIVADVKEAATDLIEAVDSAVTESRRQAIRGPRLAKTQAYTEAVRAERLRVARARWDETPLSWERLGGELNQLLDADAIVVPELAETTWSGVGDNGALDQLSFAPAGKRKIGRTTGSALGWGVGAAIGVKLAQPNRQVVALQGDGGFLFAQAESLWTMARYEVPVIVIIFNNRSYNGPRNKIMRTMGRQAQSGRDMTCYLGDPDVDFVKVAAGFGVKGEAVTSPNEIRPALRRAIEVTRGGKPYLVEALVARTGLAADSTWHPKYSVAAARTRKV